MSPTTGQWKLNWRVVFTLGEAWHEYDLTFDGEDWTLDLNAYEGEGPDGPEEIPGTSFTWTTPEEFWGSAGVLDEHQVAASDVVTMLRENGAPELVELAGALDAYEAPPSPVYVHPKGRFALAPPMPRSGGHVWGRTQPAGAPVPRGLVLFDFDRALAYRYDAALGSEGGWVTEPGIARGRTEEATVATMPDGRVLVVGGDGPNGRAIDVYVPSTAAVAHHVVLAEARARPIVAVLDDGRVVVIGGAPTSSGSATLELSIATEIVDLAAETTSPRPRLSDVRSRGSAHCLPDGRILVVGGRPDYPGAIHRSTDILDIKLGTTEPGPELPGRGGRMDHTSIRLRDGRILLVGGDGKDEGWMVGAPSIDILDPGALSFHRLPGNEMLRQMWSKGASAIELVDGRVLVTGGNFGTASAVVVDLAEATATDVGPMEFARSHHISASLPGGRALIAGGYRGGVPAGELSAEFFLGLG